MAFFFRLMHIFLLGIGLLFTGFISTSFAQDSVVQDSVVQDSVNQVSVDQVSFDQVSFDQTSVASQKVKGSGSKTIEKQKVRLIKGDIRGSSKNPNTKNASKNASKYASQNASKNAIEEPGRAVNIELLIQHSHERLEELEKQGEVLSRDGILRKGRLSEIERRLKLRLPKIFIKSELKRWYELTLESARASANAMLVKLEKEHIQKELLSLSAEYEDRKNLSAKANTENQRDEREEEYAQQALESAIKSEALASDELMKKMTSEERTLAEKLVDITLRRSAEIKDRVIGYKNEINAIRIQHDVFLKKLEIINVSLSRRERREKVDPLLGDLMHARKALRVKIKLLTSKKETLHSAFEVAQVNLIEARKTDAKDLHIEGEDGRLEKQRAKNLSLKLQIADKIRSNAVLEYETLSGLLTKGIMFRDFLSASIDAAFSAASKKGRTQFIDISSIENWKDGWVGVEEGIDRVVRSAQKRVGGFADIWKSAFEFAWWIARLIGLILGVIIGLRILMPFVPRVTKWLVKKLFTQSFFAGRPLLAIKLSEILRVIIRPVVWYIAAFLLFNFVEKTFSEVQVLVWIIDAVFLFSILIRIVEVLVLPRWYRRKMGSASVDEDDESLAKKESVDLLGKELTRAKKLVWSAKIIVTFWLVAIYVPSFIEIIIGFSIISFYAQAIIWSFFLFLFFLVVSRWKNELSNLFHEIAHERLPRASSFVVENKDRWYGVIVIGFASFYVAFFEIKQWIRTYFFEMEWYTRINNFLFRKKIELQSKKGEEARAQEFDEPHLPSSFTDYFMNDALELPSELYVEHEVRSEMVFSQFEKWKTKKRQGSVAIVGEEGLGKTTFLRRIKLRFLDSDFETELYAVDTKMRRRTEVLKYMCSVFGIEESQGIDLNALVEAIRKEKPCVILLDDCHHFFMRQIGGFDGLETLLDIVNLTDENHFYVLAFNRFTWSYINRVSPRSHYFGCVVEFKPWTVDALQKVIEKRCAPTGLLPSYSELIVTHDDQNSTDYYVEVVKTANGYFRYLQEFSKGNLSVAMCYWLRSLRMDEDALRVSLFSRPELWSSMADDNWFVLTAIAQHGTLSASEVAQVGNLDEGFCVLAINYFVEKEIVTLLEARRSKDRGTFERRATLNPLFFRQVLRHLENSNYL